MKLSLRQQGALGVLLAFTPSDFNPTEKAVEMFFAYTDKGQEPKAQWTASPAGHPEPDRDYGGFCELMAGHSLANGLQATMWLDEHFLGRLSLALVCADYLLDGIENPKKGLRKLPVFKMLQQLHYSMIPEATKRLWSESRQKGAK